MRLLGAGADAGGCLGPASAHLQGPLNIYTCTEDQVWQKSVIFIKKNSWHGRVFSGWTFISQISRGSEERRKKKEERRRKKYIGFCYVAFNKDLKRKSKSWFLEGERWPKLVFNMFFTRRNKLVLEGRPWFEAKFCSPQRVGPRRYAVIWNQLLFTKKSWSSKVGHDLKPTFWFFRSRPKI